jgi:hypothetical protein
MNKFSKANFLKISKDLLEFQLKNLYPLQIKDDRERTNIVFLNHDRNFSTFLTIKCLFEHGRIADIYTLSRSMFESIISMGLLSKRIIKNDLVRYKDYQFTEIYKTYSHLQKLGLETTSGLSQKYVNYVKIKKDEYLNKFGKNLSTWTGKNLEENVILVDHNYPPSCNENRFYEYLYCQVYRKGSQSAHGSFAGLSKGVDVEKIKLPGNLLAQRFKPNEPHLIFSCFHSIIVFVSSVRFIGTLLNNKETENYFQKITRYIISES